MKKLLLGASLLLFSGCASIQPGDMDLDNPFESEYRVTIENAKGTKGHSDIVALEKQLKNSGQKNAKRVKLSYSVKNKLSEMNSTYGSIILPFEIFTLGALDLIGVPSDFMAQTVYMNGEVLNERGRTIGTYSSSGSAWHTVAVYYGYSFIGAQRMADVRAFNKALNNLYEEIQENNEHTEVSTDLLLTNSDFDRIVTALVNDIIESGALNKSNGKYILAISDIELDTEHDVDLDIFEKKLRIALQKEKKVIMSTMTEDALIMKSRQLRQSKEVSKENVAAKNSLVAPEISLTGSIVEKVISSNEVQYTIMLTINDLKKGTSLWEGEKTIKKVVED